CPPTRRFPRPNERKQWARQPTALALRAPTRNKLIPAIITCCPHFATHVIRWLEADPVLLSLRWRGYNTFPNGLPYQFTSALLSHKPLLPSPAHLPPLRWLSRQSVSPFM